MTLSLPIITSVSCPSSNAEPLPLCSTPSSWTNLSCVRFWRCPNMCIFICLTASYRQTSSRTSTHLRKNPTSSPLSMEKLAKPKKKSAKPTEVSAKVPVGRFKNVMGQATRKKFVDPRFNDLCGEFRPEIFNTAYSFVDQYKKDELNLVKKELEEEADPDRKDEMQKFIQRRTQELSSKEQQAAAQKKINELKKQEAEAVRKGKAPFFLKKSKLKQVELESKYENVKAKGNLKKFLEKKRRSNASKDRRWLPFEQRAE
eukprot:TRINITY_DN12960_c0_g1_i2.p1 TRINITY_DN12960_c0_g1~~TRINITY_DN12960_c0_g1_i2.p1  ORF type:complete len:258 (-),score=70.85 TRINITY_DN12960_c0_g1_i2:49-822(-)